MYRALYSRLDGVVNSGVDPADDDVELIREVVPDVVDVRVGDHQGRQRLFLLRADGSKKICAPGWVVKTLKEHHKTLARKHRRPVNVNPPADTFTYPHELLCCGLRGGGTCLATLPPVIHADFTVSFLVKITRYADQRAMSLLLDNRPRYALCCTDGWWSGWAFEVLPSGWWSVRVGLGHSWHALGNMPRVVKDEWTAMCLTYVHSSTTLRMYVNGELRCEECVPRVVHATSPLRAAAGPHGARGTGVDGRMRKVTILQTCTPPAGPLRMRKTYSDLRGRRRREYVPSDEAHALDALLHDARRHMRAIPHAFSDDGTPGGGGAPGGAGDAGKDAVTHLTTEVGRLVSAFERVAMAMESTVARSGITLQAVPTPARGGQDAAVDDTAVPPAPRATRLDTRPATAGGIRGAREEAVRSPLTTTALHQHRQAQQSAGKKRRAPSPAQDPQIPPLPPPPSPGMQGQQGGGATVSAASAAGLLSPTSPLSGDTTSNPGLSGTLPMAGGGSPAPLQRHLVQPGEIVPPSPSHWSPTQGITGERQGQAVVRSSTELVLRGSSEKRSMSVRSSMSSGATMLSRWKSMMLEPAEGGAGAQGGEAWDRTPPGSDDPAGGGADARSREPEDVDEVPAVVVDLDAFTLTGTMDDVFGEKDKERGAEPAQPEAAADRAPANDSGDKSVASDHRIPPHSESTFDFAVTSHTPSEDVTPLTEALAVQQTHTQPLGASRDGDDLDALQIKRTLSEGVDVDAAEGISDAEVRTWVQLIRQRFPPCYSAKGLAKPAEVRPGLFFGDAKMGKKVGDLASRGVKKVVNLAPQQSRTSRETYFGSDIEYMEIDASDDPSYPIMNDLAGVVSFVDEKPCFVHCFQGVNRSAAIMAGYIMCIHRVGLLQAVRECHQARPVCFVGNDGFIEALIRHADKIGLLFDEEEEEEEPAPDSPLSHLSRQPSQHLDIQHKASFRSVKSFRSTNLNDVESPLLAPGDDRRLSRRSSPAFDMDDSDAILPPTLSVSPHPSFSKHGRRTNPQQSVYHSQTSIGSLGRVAQSQEWGPEAGSVSQSPTTATAHPHDSAGKPSPLGYAYTSSSAFRKDKAEEPDPIDELMPPAEASPQPGGRASTQRTEGDGVSQGGDDSMSRGEADDAQGGATTPPERAVQDDTVPNIDDLFSPIRRPVEESPQPWPRRRGDSAAGVHTAGSGAAPALHLASGDAPQDAPAAAAAASAEGPSWAEDLTTLDDIFSPVDAPQEWPRPRPGPAAGDSPKAPQPLPQGAATAVGAASSAAHSGTDGTDIDDLFSPRDAPATRSTDAAQQWPRRKSSDATGHSRAESSSHSPRAGRRAPATPSSTSGTPRSLHDDTTKLYSTLPSPRSPRGQATALSITITPESRADASAVAAADAGAGRAGRRGGGRRAGRGGAVDDDLFADLSATVARRSNASDSPRGSAGPPSPREWRRGSEQSLSVPLADMSASGGSRSATPAAGSGGDARRLSASSAISGRRGSSLAGQQTPLASRRGSRVAPLKRTFTDDLFDGFDTTATAATNTTTSTAPPARSGRHGGTGRRTSSASQHHTHGSISPHHNDTIIHADTAAPAPRPRLRPGSHSPGRSQDSDAYSEAFSSPAGRSPRAGRRSASPQSTLDYDASPGASPSHGRRASRGTPPLPHDRSRSKSPLVASSPAYSDGFASYDNDFEEASVPPSRSDERAAPQAAGAQRASSGRGQRASLSPGGRSLDDLLQGLGGDGGSSEAARRGSRRVGLRRQNSGSPFGLSQDFVPFDAAEPAAPTAHPVAGDALGSPVQSQGRAVRAGRRGGPAQRESPIDDAFAPHPSSLRGSQAQAQVRKDSMGSLLGDSMAHSSVFSPTGRADRDFLNASPTSAADRRDGAWPADSDPLGTELSLHNTQDNTGDTRSSSWDSRSESSAGMGLRRQHTVPAAGAVATPPQPQVAVETTAAAADNYDDWDDDDEDDAF